MTRKYLKYILAAISAIFVLSSAHVKAAATTFELSAPPSVVAGDRFRVEFTITNGNPENFTAPTFTGFNVLAGPTPSIGTHITIVGTKQELLPWLTYTYVLEAPSTPGKGTISASSIVSDGKTYSTKAANIDILPPGSSAAGSGSGRGGSTAQGGLSSDDIILRMDVTRTSAYKGQALVASLTLYTRVGIAGLENAKYPAFNGFWADEIDVSNNRAVGRSTIGGKEYQSQVVRQWLLYPQKAGTLEIERSEFTAIAQVVTQAVNNGSLFDQFFGGGHSVENVRRSIVASPVKISVKDLPQPAPAGFAGAVGKFNLDASISSNTMNANSAGSITLKINGSGNFNFIEPPRLTLPAAFEQYDAKKSDKITTTTTGTSGVKEFEYPFVARAEGKYDIDALTFSYFDPEANKYVTLSSGNFNIEILADNTSGRNSQSIISGVTKENVKLLGQDIRFIRIGSPQFSTSGKVFLWSVPFFMTLIVILAVFAGLLFFLQKRIRERADIVKVKNKKANKVALRRLRKAKVYMMAGEETKFFEEMLRALWGYMGDKLAIPVANLTKEKIREDLSSKGIEPQQSEDFLTLISECEMAQYSPQAGIQMDKAYTAALDLIGRLENKV